MDQSDNIIRVGYFQPSQEYQSQSSAEQATVDQSDATATTIELGCEGLDQLRAAIAHCKSAVMIFASGLSPAGIFAGESSICAISHSAAKQHSIDSESSDWLELPIGIYIEHLRQRSYLATAMTWIYYWLSRLLFGVRKAPAYPVAMHFQNARQLVCLIDQLRSADGLSHETEKRAIGLKWIDHVLSWLDQPQSDLDRVLHAAAANGIRLQQMESESSTILPRRSHWTQRLRTMVCGAVAIAKMVRDWWNWRVFNSKNARALEQADAGLGESRMGEGLVASSTTGRVEAYAADKPSRQLNWLAWGSLLLCSVAVIGTQTDYPLFEPDEARNSQLAINIYETGDWVSLHLGAEPYWDKPPAVAWGTAVAYHLFGVSSWSTRLVSNVTAILTVLMTFFFGRRLLGFRAAWLGSFLLLLSVGFVICGRYATMDAAITCCAIAMLGSMTMAVRGKRFAYGYWLVASVACGVGLLVKGPVIGVLTLPPLFVWLWMTRNASLLRVMPWVMMSVIALAIAGPWFVMMGVTEPDFLVYFFWKHHVVRFSDAFNHREPFWFYLPVLVLGTFPASLLLPTLIPLFRRYGDSCRRALTPAMGLVAMYALWVVGFFSLSDSKLPTYILPSFPAVALLYAVAGVSFADDLGRQTSSTGNRFLHYFFSIPKRTAVTFSIAVVAFSIVSVVLFKHNAWTSWFSVIASAGLLLCVVAWFNTWFSKARTAVAMGTSLMLGLLFVITMTSYVLPEVSSFRSIQRTAAQLYQRDEFKDLPIVFYSHENYGCQIWLPQDSIVSFDEYDMVKTINYLNQKQTCLLVSRLEAMEMLSSNLNASLTLSSIKGARHLYLCHPVEKSASQPADQVVERLADRLQTVTYTR